MREYFERAIANVIKHGDTDIFPFPIENHVFFDKQSEVIELLLDLNTDLQRKLALYPPSNNSALAPVGYAGFRWATQLDPLWNAYFLGVVISIAGEIEEARIPISEQTIFSYRYHWNPLTADLFDNDCNWRAFMEHSLVRAQTSNYVVVCDISEFYPRLNHHRLENSLKQLRLPGDQASKIMDFLANFSGTDSYGIPIGGPAARILSELLLNQIDRLLKAEGINFCRFADDYHLFADDYEHAFKGLLYLSEKLLSNQGLQIQKSKTRIMSGQEFISTSPLARGGDFDEPTTPVDADQTPLPIKTLTAADLLGFSIRFDPYSPAAREEYEELRKEIQKYDIISLLRSELAKSRIHISLSKKIVTAIRYIDDDLRDDAVLSLIKNADLLYPIYANVLIVAKSLFPDLTKETQDRVQSEILALIRQRSHVLQPELNLAYSVRLIAASEGPEKEEILNRVYAETRSSRLRADIILIMAKWRASYWLSDLRTRFGNLSAAERRAFIVSSYVLADEGSHWRSHIKQTFSPFEVLVRDWAAERAQLRTWSIPI
jgi:hypothetical protein